MHINAIYAIYRLLHIQVLRLFAALHSLCNLNDSKHGKQKQHCPSFEGGGLLCGSKMKKATGCSAIISRQPDLVAGLK